MNLICQAVAGAQRTKNLLEVLGEYERGRALGVFLSEPLISELCEKYGGRPRVCSKVRETAKQLVLSTWPAHD